VSISLFFFVPILGGKIKPSHGLNWFNTPGGEKMSIRLRKLYAILTVLLAALGILISLFFILEVWQNRQPVTEKLQTGVDQFSSMLQTSDDGLMVIDQVVKNVYTSTIYLDAATQALSQTVGSTTQFMSTAGTIVGDNLLSTITSTQAALNSAQASARVIDNVLGTLSKLPLIGISYNPAIPLNTALGDVASSLDPLQGALKDFQTNLVGARTDLQGFTKQIVELDNNILSVQKNLDQAQLTIQQYHTQISTMRSDLANARANLPAWTNRLAWVLTLIIVWAILLQVALLLQGITQIGPSAPSNRPTDTAG
jgi:predicted PurR-regulated permease PerM